jgi:hypothetical protein
MSAQKKPRGSVRSAAKRVNELKETLVKNNKLKWILGPAILVMVGVLISSRSLSKKANNDKTPGALQKNSSCNNGLPETPEILKSYLTLLVDKNGFHENQCLNPQSSASIDMGNGLATISCSYRFLNSEWKPSVSGRLQVGGSIEWKKPPSSLDEKTKNWVRSGANSCLVSLVSKKVITDKELEQIILIYTENNLIKQAIKSGIPIGDKWIFNIVPTDYEKDTVYMLTEK